MLLLTADRACYHPFASSGGTLPFGWGDMCYAVWGTVAQMKHIYQRSCCWGCKHRRCARTGAHTHTQIMMRLIGVCVWRSGAERELAQPGSPPSCEISTGPLGAERNLPVHCLLLPARSLCVFIFFLPIGSIFSAAVTGFTCLIVCWGGGGAGRSHVGWLMCVVVLKRGSSARLSVKCKMCFECYGGNG